MTTDERPAPAIDAPERAMLEGWLDHHRATLAKKCEGLTDAQLREASVPPSGLTLLGLVRHLTENERGWFREVLAGEDLPPVYGTDKDPDGEFRLTGSDTWEEAERAWRAEIEAARANAATVDLDGLSMGVGKQGKPFSLRWIYMHMIEEYARHNGHADLVRERIDGARGL
ncbi:DinB family protein [Streptomyces sp. NBC_01754]|uniref:DinB family protein n=1 Tax=Streptomyces sp. NBC_01754 TaxID=2975930 RepID=UPI002DDACFC3|nr:DinB family protein [Streptomyces sp. NBC_01754]WSC91341.1 DinB family protein [Streptomyces sp. NBC_01754]